MPRGTRGRSKGKRGYVLAEVLAAAAGALALIAAAQVFLCFWQAGTGGLTAAGAARSASVLQERLARDAGEASGVRVPGGGSGLEFALPDGRVVSYSYSGGQVLRDGVPLAWGLSEARFWADLSGARPVAGVDLQARGLRLRAAAAVGPPL